MNCAGLFACSLINLDIDARRCFSKWFHISHHVTHIISSKLRKNINRRAKIVCAFLQPCHQDQA